MNKKWKDILKRALKTFLQGFVGALPITITLTDLTNEAMLKSILIGALASGISALHNFILTLLKKEL